MVSGGVVWIAPPLHASAPAPPPEPEPPRRRPLPKPAPPRQPRRFWLLTVGDIPHRREWMKVDESTWEERDLNGSVSRYRMMGRSRERGRMGIIVRRIPDDTLDIFIPDLDQALWLEDRVAPDGEWHPLGPIHLVE